MARIDLFGTVHKGLRAELFGAVALAARTDFAAAPEAARVAAAARRLAGLLGEHAEHEDAVVLPELAALVPELHAAIAADHSRLEALHVEVVSLADRLERAATAAERDPVGRRLHDRLGRLAAEHLLHMRREEEEVLRALWAHRSDEALAILHGRILARIPPARMATWLAVILGAASLPEQARLVGSVRAAVADPAFAELTAPARAALGEAGWRDVVRAAGVTA
jgi:hypothetical protein